MRLSRFVGRIFLKVISDCDKLIVTFSREKKKLLHIAKEGEKESGRKLRCAGYTNVSVGRVNASHNHARSRTRRAVQTTLPKHLLGASPARSLTLCYFIKLGGACLVG